MLNPRDVLLAMYFKFKGDNVKIFQALKNKERLTQEDYDKIDQEILEIDFQKLVTIIDDDYPNECKTMLNPPIAIWINKDSENVDIEIVDDIKGEC